MTYRAYFHDKELSHTISKYTGITKNVVTFLKSHDAVTAEEIAITLAVHLMHSDLVSMLKSPKVAIRKS